MMKKIIAIVTTVTCAAWLAGPVYGITAADLQAQIDQLLATIAGLQNQLAAMGEGTVAYTGCTITTFDRNLTVGMTGDDVKCLQVILNSDSATKIAHSGVGSSG